MNVLLYVTVVLIWGSTWLAIKYQIGVVNPIASVGYRFGLAAAVLFAIAAMRGLPLRYDRIALARFALLGALMFSINFMLVYNAERYLTTGLVALIFALTLPANMVNSLVFLRKRPSLPTVVGGAIGVVGIAAVFWPDLVAFNLNASTGRGIVLALGGTMLFSLGQIASSAYQRASYGVLPSTAYAMAFGMLFCALTAPFLGGLQFDPAPRYVLSLLYLAIPGSVIAFVAYLTLIGRVGANAAGYTSVLVPIVALALSTFVEGYTWTLRAATGVALIVLGNAVALTDLVAIRRAIARHATAPDARIG